MEIGDTKIPDEMSEAANNEFFKAASLNGLPNVTDGERLGFALIAAVRWLRDKVLHPANAEFHRAILDAERERFQRFEQDGVALARRVDFEYGVSFARNYISSMFSAKLPEKNVSAEFGERVLYLASVTFCGMTISRADANKVIDYINTCVVPDSPLPEMIGRETLSEFCSRYRRIDEAVRDAYRRGREMGGF